MKEITLTGGRVVRIAPLTPEQANAALEINRMVPKATAKDFSTALAEKVVIVNARAAIVSMGIRNAGAPATEADAIIGNLTIGEIDSLLEELAQLSFMDTCANPNISH